MVLFQSPLAERGMTVSVSPRSPVANLVAFGRQVICSATLALRISRTAWRLHIDHLCPFAPQDDLLVLPGRSLLLRLLWALRSREARTFTSSLLRSFSQVEMIYSCTDTPPFNPRMSNVAQVQTRTGKYHLLNGLLFFIILSRANR